jgi:hypothetical protein
LSSKISIVPSEDFYIFVFSARNIWNSINVFFFQKLGATDAHVSCDKGTFRHNFSLSKNLSSTLPMFQTASELRPLVVRDGGSTGESRASPLSCFSHHARASSTVMASVLQIMPGLEELCGKPVIPLFVEKVKYDSPETSIVDSPSSQTLDFSESGVVDGAVSLSLESVTMSAEKYFKGKRKKRCRQKEGFCSCLRGPI